MLCDELGVLDFCGGRWVRPPGAICGKRRARTSRLGGRFDQLWRPHVVVGRGFDGEGPFNAVGSAQHRTLHPLDALHPTRRPPRSVCGCVGSWRNRHGAPYARRWRSGRAGGPCFGRLAGARSCRAARSRSPPQRQAEEGELGLQARYRTLELGIEIGGRGMRCIGLHLAPESVSMFGPEGS